VFPDVKGPLRTDCCSSVGGDCHTKSAENSNEIVCQKQEVTGSRLGVKRICMTRSEWADRRMQDRQELERVQVQRGAKSE
jgi:hypothetical protein